MKLSELLTETDIDIEVKTPTADSRKVKSGDVFFCIKGLTSDGHDYAGKAVENGAAAVVHSEEIDKADGVVYVQTGDVIGAYNKAVDAYYGHPSSKMKMYAVTGTNGKSTTSSIIRDLIDPIMPCGYIGTIGVEYGGKSESVPLTTPDIDILHRVFADMVDAGMKACSIEASSHGIEQRRIGAVDVDVAVFTNLTHDHLDAHGTMENYFHAKKKLFDDLKEGAVAVVNADDPYGLRIAEDSKARIVTYGIESESDYRVTDYELMAESTRFTLLAPAGSGQGADSQVGKKEYKIETNLVSKFNIYNLVAAIAALIESGFTFESFEAHLNRIEQVLGRVQKIDEGQDFTVIVDYAHTPDGIEKICQYITAITPEDKRIIALTGAAGKRDKTKRPIMGAELDKCCDIVVITEEDPRDESAVAIAEDIAAGIRNAHVEIIENRYSAVKRAIELAEPGDTVMVLGKGDERYIDKESGEEAWMGDIAACVKALHELSR